MSLKYQIHPDFAAEAPAGLDFVSASFKKTVPISAVNDLPSLFEDLGAKILGNNIQFSIKASDLSKNSGETVVVVLEKVSDKENHAYVDGTKYWNESGEAVTPPANIPNDNETGENNEGDFSIPVTGKLEGVSAIDPADFATLDGHYDMIYFSTVTYNKSSGTEMVKVASDDGNKVQEMKGELQIDAFAAHFTVTSKMQMKSSFLVNMGQAAEQYAFTNYEPFTEREGKLSNNSGDTLEIYNGTPDYILIKQILPKSVTMGGAALEVNVAVTVIAKKISDEEKIMVDAPYWNDNEEGSGSSGGEDTSGIDTQAFPDQIIEDGVSSDFSVLTNFIGRYRIAEISLADSAGAVIINEKAGNDFLGTFSVAPDMGNAAAAVPVVMSMKFQFNPRIITTKAIPSSLAFVATSITKNVSMTALGDIAGLFRDLGAEVRGNKIQFTLQSPDVPVGSGESLILLLEKVSNTANLELALNGVKYWNESGENVTQPDPEGGSQPQEPEEPEEPMTPPADGITPINMNDLSTLTGQYSISRFTTAAAGTTVDSAGNNVSRMQGEISINADGSGADVISKMQMDASMIVAGTEMITASDKYNYTVYNRFSKNGESLASSGSDPYKYSSASIRRLNDSQIEISQHLKKNAPVIGTTDVQVTVIATKTSDTPSAVNDCAYWDTETVKACNADGSIAMHNVDITKPETLVGSYEIVNYGMEYQRPAGGQYEKVWWQVKILDGIIYEGQLLIDRLQGELAVKNDGSGNALDFKVQLESVYQVQKEYIYGDFNDYRWRFFRETDVRDYEVSGTGNQNELKIVLRRTFSYRYWGVQHNVPVYIFFIVKKNSDTVSAVNNTKYWPTPEPTITIPDASRKETYSGHYRLTNIGHKFFRPNSVGGTWENNWASNPNVMTGLRGEMSVKYDPNDLGRSEFKAKYQVNSSWYVLYDDGALVRTNFSDPRWKFFSEPFTDPFEVSLEGNNLKVCINRDLEYKYWKVEWLVWNNHWKTTYPRVDICFVGEKVSDDPQQIDNGRYW